MMRFFLSVCAVAIAGAPLVTPDPDWVGSESEQVGSFGNNDSSVFDDFNDLMDSLDGVGMDFIYEESYPSSSPSADVSGNFVFSDFSDFLDSYYSNLSDDSEDGVEPYSSYNSYIGSIGSTYVEYMRGYLPKLAPKEHYVGARVGQYDYVFAYGIDLQYDGYFHGSCFVVKFNTYNSGSFSVVYDPNFNLYPGNQLVYSDLSDIYPSLAVSSDVSLRQILYLLVIAFLVMIIDHMYQVRKIRRVNSRANS